MFWQASESQRRLAPRGEASLLNGGRPCSAYANEKHNIAPVRRRD
jgi:hypothetical protein